VGQRCLNHNNYKAGGFFCFMDKRGQVAIFIIVGILIVSSLMFYFVLRDEVVPESLDFDASEINRYYLGCIEDIVNAALLDYPPEKIGPLIEKRIDECSEVELLYKEIEFYYGDPKATVEKNELGSVLVVEVDYPIFFCYEDKCTKFETFDVSVPLVKKVRLSLDADGKTENEIDLDILDDRIHLIIPKGTSAVNDETGKVEEISYAVRESRDGNIVLDLKPDNTVFSKPLILKISLDDTDIPIGFDTSNLGIGVYDEDYEKYVFINGGFFDANTNEVIALISHFSLFTWGIIRSGSDCDDVVDVDVEEYYRLVEGIVERILDDYSNGTINESDINESVGDPEDSIITPVIIEFLLSLSL